MKSISFWKTIFDYAKRLFKQVGSNRYIKVTIHCSSKLIIHCSSYRNPFRELVLLHIRSTHMAIDKSSSAEAELDLLPCDQDQDVEPIETGPTATNSTLNPQSPLRPSLSPLSVVVSPRSESGNIGGLTGASPSASTTPSVTSGSASGYNSNNYTTNATLIGVGLNFSQAVVANDNRLGTTYTLSNTVIPSVVFGGEVNTTASTTTQSTTTTLSASSASASTTNTNTTTTPPSTSTTNTNTTTPTTPAGGKGASNSWRPSAPYRCGHCHQVSNWKHVIQVFARSKFVSTPFVFCFLCARENYSFFLFCFVLSAVLVQYVC